MSNGEDIKVTPRILFYVFCLFAGVALMAFSNLYPLLRSSDFQFSFEIPSAVSFIAISTFLFFKKAFKTPWILILLLFIAISVGSLFIGFSISSSIRILNAVLDKSLIQEHIVSFVRNEKWPQTGLYSSRAVDYSRWMDFYDWSPIPVKCRATLSQYQYENLPDTAVIKTKKGFFGWEWIVEITPPPQKPPK